MTSRTIFLIVGLALLAIVSVTMLSRGPDAVTEPGAMPPAATTPTAAEPDPSTAVEAPGVNVETDKATGDVKVEAPGVNVEKTDEGVSVTAPGGVEVEVPAQAPAPAP